MPTETEINRVLLATLEIAHRRGLDPNEKSHVGYALKSARVQVRKEHPEWVVKKIGKYHESDYNLQQSTEILIRLREHVKNKYTQLKKRQEVLSNLEVSELIPSVILNLSRSFPES